MASLSYNASTAGATAKPRIRIAVIGQASAIHSPIHSQRISERRLTYHALHNEHAPSHVTTHHTLAPRARSVPRPTVAFARTGTLSRACLPSATPADSTCPPPPHPP